MFYLDTS